MHAIFEDMDFTWPEDKRIALIQKKLHLYGYDENWAGVIGRMVGGILNANLPGLDDDFCLSRLTTKERINEMEFYLLQQKCDSRSFSDLFLKAGKPCLQRTGEQLGRLSFGKISGMMKGFVDLVFHWRGKYYIIDWKSNYLGDTSSDYREENLTDVMVRENYILQYFIYTVAVDQYLRTRVPGYSYQEHFGGVYYLFLRGITAKGDEGIFHDLPDQDILKRFGRFFGSPPAESSGLN